MLVCVLAGCSVADRERSRSVDRVVTLRCFTPPPEVGAVARLWRETEERQCIMVE
jgi:hypothetical protein